MIYDENLSIVCDQVSYKIGNFLRKYGRVNVTQTKEKYGTVRVYCSIGWSCLLNITHPGYCHYSPYPKWLMEFDIDHGYKIVRIFNIIVVPYHRFLYRLAYKRQVAKYPQYRDNIISCADYNELLKNI